MDMDRNLLLEHITKLAKTPTAPYNEQAFAAVLQERLAAQDIRFKYDAYGNLFARIRRHNPARQIAFVAHMDQPALRVTHVDGTLVTCVREGFLPSKTAPKTEVLFPQTHTTGTVLEHTPETVTVELHKAAPSLHIHSYGQYSHPSTRITAETFCSQHNNAVLSCASLLTALEHLGSLTEPVDVWALFTRADQLKTQGSVAVAIEQTLPRGTWIVSIEAVQAHARIATHNGPAIQTGTPNLPFDRKVTALLQAAATQNNIPSQHAVLDGKTCSASAFTAFGYATSALGIPFKHLSSPEETDGIPLEESTFNDILNTAKLIVSAALRTPSTVEDADALRNTLVTESESGRQLLKSPLDPNTHYPVVQYF
jgi:YD repeat-containing protein